MLTTEAEAKTKRCQESYPASQGLTTDGSTMSTSMPMVSHGAYGAGYGGSYAVQTASAPLCCLGSACMAWRWGRLIKVYDSTMIEGEFTVRQELGGYCGKAGKPVQIDMKDAT